MWRKILHRHYIPICGMRKNIAFSIKLKMSFKSLVAVHFTREIIEETESCDVSLKDNTPLEFPDAEQNDLWNITNDTIDNNNKNITDIYNSKLLGPGDAPPSNASLGEVKL